LQPGNAEVYGWLGNALGEQNKLADAIPFYLTALKLNPADGRNEFNLGLTFSRLGRLQEAAEHFRQALRLNPGNADAEAALRQLQTAPDLSPGKN
jgi:tetratricopeptide (TPR) repeat protein